MVKVQLPRRHRRSQLMDGDSHPTALDDRNRHLQFHGDPGGAVRCDTPGARGGSVRRAWTRLDAPGRDRWRGAAAPARAIMPPGDRRAPRVPSIDKRRRAGDPGERPGTPRRAAAGLRCDGLRRTRRSACGDQLAGAPRALCASCRHEVVAPRPCPVIAIAIAIAIEAVARAAPARRGRPARRRARRRVRARPSRGAERRGRRVGRRSRRDGSVGATGR